jgi:hypothetical protein
VLFTERDEYSLIVCCIKLPCRLFPSWWRLLKITVCVDHEGLPLALYTTRISKGTSIAKPCVNGKLQPSGESITENAPRGYVCFRPRGDGHWS